MKKNNKTETNARALYGVVIIALIISKYYYYLFISFIFSKVWTRLVIYTYIYIKYICAIVIGFLPAPNAMLRTFGGQARN